ncbi:ketoacyl-synthetase C-terminal extension domain-containing protein [Bacillus sp. SL00103]
MDIWIKNGGRRPGLIKAVLSLQHHTFVPSSLKKANENIAFEHSPFFVNTDLTDWKQPASHLRRAGVSSFGMGGTNAHVILEEAPQRDRQQMPRSAELLVLSAKSKTSLERMKEKLASQIENTPSINLADAPIRRKQEDNPWFPSDICCASREDALRVLREKARQGHWKAHAFACGETKDCFYVFWTRQSISQYGIRFVPGRALL